MTDIFMFENREYVQSVYSPIFSVDENRTDHPEPTISAAEFPDCSDISDSSQPVCLYMQRLEQRFGVPKVRDYHIRAR